MTLPSPTTIRAHLDHLEASCLGIQDAINLRQGKREDGLNPVREARLRGLRACMKTLEWLLAVVERKAAA